MAADKKHFISSIIYLLQFKVQNVQVFVQLSKQVSQSFILIAVVFDPNAPHN